MMHKAHNRCYVIRPELRQLFFCPAPVYCSIDVWLMPLPQYRETKCFDTQGGEEVNVIFPCVMARVFKLIPKLIPDPVDRTLNSTPDLRLVIRHIFFHSHVFQVPVPSTF